jgi:hypothetical protein
MDSVLDPLEMIRQAGVAFLRSPEVRVLSVTVDNAIADPAIEILEQLEWHPANRSQVVVLAGDDFTPGDGGWWSSSADQIRRAYSAVQTSYSKAGRPAPGEWPVESAVEIDPLLSFSCAVGAVLTRLCALPDGPAGLIVLVAPRRVGDPVELATGLSTIVAVPALARVRWICVGDSLLAPQISARVESSQLQMCAARADTARLDADVEALLLSMAGTAPDVPVRPGCATSAASVPPHPTDPRILPDPVQSPLAGLPREALLPFADGVRALRRGDALDAVRHQRAVCDLCISVGQAPVVVEMELLLGTYAVQACFTAGAPIDPAIRVLQSAATRATGAELHLASAKANYILGTVAAATNDNYLAGESFRRAAKAAHAAGSPALEIEALRAVGERLLDLGSESAAATILAEAEAAGVGFPPEVVKNTSLAVFRNRLDELMRRPRVAPATAVTISEPSLSGRSTPADPQKAAGDESRVDVGERD